MEREIENMWVKMQRVEAGMDSLAFSSNHPLLLAEEESREKTGCKSRGGLQIWCSVGGLSWWFLFIFIFGEARE